MHTHDYFQPVYKFFQFQQIHGADRNQGNAAIYGMLSVVPSDGIIDNFLIDLFDEIYKS